MADEKTEAAVGPVLEAADETPGIKNRKLMATSIRLGEDQHAALYDLAWRCHSANSALIRCIIDDWFQDWKRDQGEEAVARLTARLKGHEL